MARYAVFGFELESDIELPELLPASGSGAPDWQIRTARTAPPAGAYEPIGDDVVYADVCVRALASATTFRIVFDDTGTFDVAASARSITWYPGESPTRAAVRADVLGRVMALAAHASGAFTLHASAVAIGGEAIALLGPKHAGKSTLALALVGGGARLVTDDTLVIRVDGHGAAWAAPGVQRVRLWEDAARALDVQSRGEPGVKPTIDALPADRVQTADVRLTACYVIHAAPSAAEAVSRTALSPIHAALSYVRFSKLGPLAGRRENAVVLDRAAAVSAVVPVFAAEVRRDLATLDEAAATFLAWHERARSATTGAAR